jgi:hypothetical protein
VGGGAQYSTDGAGWRLSAYGTNSRLVFTSSPFGDSRVVGEDEKHDTAAKSCAQARDVARPGEDLVWVDGELDLTEDTEQIDTAVLDAEDAICSELDGAGAPEVVAVRGDRDVDRELRTGGGAEEIDDDAGLIAKQMGPPIVECRRHTAEAMQQDCTNTA